MAQTPAIQQDQTDELFEIRNDYKVLTFAIDQWIDENCATFLNNEALKFEQWQDTWKFRGLQENFELGLSNHYKRLGEWPDAKRHILNVLIMRYIFDYILNSSFPPWLPYESQNLLVTIENNLPKRDIYYLRSWRRDTILSILSPSAFMRDRTKGETELANGLYYVVRNALPNYQPNYFVSSIQSKIIKRSVELAQKVQSSLNIWTFRYSPHWTSPAQYTSHLQGFFNNLPNFACVNLIDDIPLATEDIESERNALVYLQDIYPGLYRQEVNADTVLEVVTVSRPLLLVTFR